MLRNPNYYQLSEESSFNWVRTVSVFCNSFAFAKLKKQEQCSSEKNQHFTGIVKAISKKDIYRYFIGNVSKETSSFFLAKVFPLAFFSRELPTAESFKTKTLGLRDILINFLA